MRIDILYFDGCPHHGPTVELVSEVVHDLGIQPTVNEIKVSGLAGISGHRFLGSPTIRVDGRDIEPGAEDRTEFAMSCRRYGESGVPPRALIEAALRAGSQL